MAEITIVTALFDVGRKKWTDFERDTETYLEYFKFWARIRNKVIIYTDRITGEKVLKIREEFGLQDRTKVIVIDCIEECDPDIYQRMEKTIANKRTVNYRKYPKNPESYSAKYNYIMLLKSWFVKNAVENGYADGMIAWLDFGYNHGGETYTDPCEFDYMWEYDFSDKIHLFSIAPLDDTPIFEIVYNMDVYFSGGVIVAPADKWGDLWSMVRNSMYCLTQCGFVDDDQTLMLMAYREYPELFEVHYIEDWFLPLKIFGGNHLTVKKKKKKSKISIFWRDFKKKHLK